MTSKSRFPYLLLLLLFPFLSLSSSFVHAGETDESEEESEPSPKKKKKTKKKASSAAAEYVRVHLKDYLNATELKFDKDGRVTMKFDFCRRNDSQAEIFSPKIASTVRNTFRWTVRREWPYGLRISDQGMALLNCWFKDDVSAEIDYAQGTNFQKRHTSALVFYSEKKKVSIGNNYGTQCVKFRKAKRAGTKGKTEEFLRKRIVKIKLEVKDGEFKAYKNGRLKSSSTYKKKDMPNGRIGFIWNGGVAGIVPTLTVTGELDVEKMLKVIRKAERS